MSVAITDFSQFGELRAAAERRDPEALAEVAGQFEALFLQMMLKSMRDASFGDPLMGDSRQQEMYRDMMDQQLALDMSSGKGIGLAEMIVRQLGNDPARPSAELAPAARNAAATPPPPNPSERIDGEAEPDAGWSDPESFAQSVWPYVRRAAARLNVSPVGILAQAALETGWGARVMPRSDGSSSLNLFGIKAGSQWNGDSVKKQTVEFRDGVAAKESARFRAYDDVAQSLADYTAFLSDSDRYAGVRNRGEDTAGFARALQDAGYATDPQYAQKIADIVDSPTMKRVLSAVDRVAGRQE